MHRPRLALSTCLFLLSAALPIRAEVWIVEESGPLTFFAIQDAVDAAADGDTVLVRPGHYVDRVVIRGKSLVLVADGPGVEVSAFSPLLFGYEPTIRAEDLDPGQSVLVRGFELVSGVVVRDCEGTVWFDAIDVRGRASCYDGGIAGALLERSERVTFTACTLVGHNGNSVDGNTRLAAPGLQAEEANAELFDCVVRGGPGQNTLVFSSATPGAPGAQVDDSTLTLLGCALEGGAGGFDPSAVCSSVPEPSGVGLAFVGTQGVVRSAASTAVGGQTDLSLLCPGLSAPAGPAITGTGTIVPLPGYARHLRANGPVRGGETLTLALEGQPGELPFVLVSATHDTQFLPAHGSTLLVGFPLEELFALPALPASGEASLAFVVPNVGAVGAAVHLYAQPFFLDPTPRVWLGCGASLLLLDASL